LCDIPNWSVFSFQWGQSSNEIVINRDRYDSLIRQLTMLRFRNSLFTGLEVEAPRSSRKSVYKGGEVVSPGHTQQIILILISVRG